MLIEPVNTCLIIAESNLRDTAYASDILSKHLCYCLLNFSRDNVFADTMQTHLKAVEITHYLQIATVRLTEMQKLPFSPCLLQEDRHLFRRVSKAHHAQFDIRTTSAQEVLSEF